MGVHIDETGSDQEAAGIDFPPVRAFNPPDPGDQPVNNLDIALERIPAGSVGNGAAANDEPITGHGVI